MVQASTQPLTEMSTRNIPGGKRRPVRRVDNLTTFMCRFFWNPRALSSWNCQGPSRTVQGFIYLSLLPQNIWVAMMMIIMTKTVIHHWERCNLKINLLKPIVQWCTNSLTSNNCTICPHCIYVFCIYLRTNSDLCHLQHKLIGFYNRDEKCLLRGTNWAFK